MSVCGRSGVKMWTVQNVWRWKETTGKFSRWKLRIRFTGGSHRWGSKVEAVGRREEENTRVLMVEWARSHPPRADGGSTNGLTKLFWSTVLARNYVKTCWRSRLDDCLVAKYLKLKVVGPRVLDLVPLASAEDNSFAPSDVMTLLARLQRGAGSEAASLNILVLTRPSPQQTCTETSPRHRHTSPSPRATCCQP